MPDQRGDNSVGAAALRIFVDHRAAQDPGAADFMAQQAQGDAAPAAQGSEDSEMNQVDEEDEQEGEEDQEDNEDQEGQDDHLWTDLFDSDVTHEIKVLQIIKDINVTS